MRSKSYNKPATNYKHQCGKSNKNMWKQLKILFIPQILLLVVIHHNHVVKNVSQGTKKFNSLVRSKHYRKSWNVIARLIMYFFIRVKYDFRRNKIDQNWLQALIFFSLGFGFEVFQIGWISSSSWLRYFFF